MPTGTGINMDDNKLKEAIDRLKEAKEILEKFSSREEAIEYLVNETKLSKEECSNAYDILIRIDLNK